MSTKSDCPASFFVDVCVPGIPQPMRELVRFSATTGLCFNAKFSRRYSYLPSSAFVDRASSPWLRYFDSVHFCDILVDNVLLFDRRVPVR